MNVLNINIDISIIIVNYKSWIHLERCLNSLEIISCNNKNIEVIIVDNCSNDGEILSFKERFKMFKFIENSGNNGFANGCNLGVKKALGTHLLFLNPDTLITHEAIFKMYNYLIDNVNCGIVSCVQKNKISFENKYRFFPNYSTLFGVIRAINKTFLLRRIKKDENVIFPDWVSGAVVFISRHWFDKVKGWNEDYWMYFEDVDLCKKVFAMGGKIALLTDTEIIHNHGGSSRLNIKTAIITKTEVIISKHVYIRNHFKGFHHFIIQFMLVLVNFVEKIILAFFGVLFFFIPKLRLQLFLFINLASYYIKGIVHRSWLSLKSMNNPSY